MKIRTKSKIIGFLFIILVLIYFIGKKEKVVAVEVDMDKIEDFDIILSKGQSLQSKLVSLVKFSMNDYSHIGIMIKGNDKVFVLHSTPDGTKTNGIRYDDLQTFFNLSDVSDYTVLRYQDISFDYRQNLRREFSRYKTIHAPFDFDFNNFENGRIYCSELVWLTFKNAGLFKSSNFNLQKPIYPKYFLTMNRFFTVNVKKTCP